MLKSIKKGCKYCKHIGKNRPFFFYKNGQINVPRIFTSTT